MTGREEGVYEWVAANYARSMVKVDPTDTIGVLHLGDESAEVLLLPLHAHEHSVGNCFRMAF